MHFVLEIAKQTAVFHLGILRSGAQSSASTVSVNNILCPVVGRGGVTGAAATKVAH